jgi:uncharacterized protein YacL
VKKILSSIVNVFGWLVILFTFSSIGFATSKPATGVPLYMLFFIIVFAGVYYYVTRQKHSMDKETKKNAVFSRILGAIILLVALLMPWFIYARINLTVSAYLVITLIAAAAITISIFAVRLINKSQNNSVPRILGYLILIALSAIPALAAIYYFLPFFNRPYDALGTAYWCTIAVAVLAWWGFSLIGKKS